MTSSLSKQPMGVNSSNHYMPPINSTCKLFESVKILISILNLYLIKSHCGLVMLKCEKLDSIIIPHLDHMI